jgi:Mrp family chromosome partitioning ATPase
MSQLTALFDWLIIDSPPILPLADTSVWSRLADGILLVARQGITEKRQLQRGLEALDRQKLIGALLNSSHSSATSDHYYYYRPSSAPGAAGNPTEK